MQQGMETAFNTAAGFNSGHVATGIILIVGAVAYLWGSNAIRSLLSMVMNQSTEMPRGTRYVIRVAILLAILTYIMS